MVQAHRTSSNLLRMNDSRESAVYRVFSHKFGVVQAHRTSSNLLKKHAIRESEVCRVVSHKFGVVQAQRTSANLLKKHAIRESEVYRVHISSGWFKHIEPHRTSSKSMLLVQCHAFWASGSDPTGCGREATCPSVCFLTVDRARHDE